MLLLGDARHVAEVTAGGFGVYYPTMMVNKFGLATGEDYRAQGRMFCDANVTSYRSTWTNPIFWTQPGVAPIRLEGGSAIYNFDVYPNPSKDIFNISFGVAVSLDFSILDFPVQYFAFLRLMIRSSSATQYLIAPACL